MPALRPVQTDDRLTLVEHLGELRARLVVSIAIVVVAFAFTYWQNSRVLDVVNRPLDKAQTANVGCAKKVDPIAQAGCFDQAVARALGQLEPVISDLAREATPRQVQRARDATAALRHASRIAPEATERKPVTLGVAEPFFQTINVALYAAIVIALPLLLYQAYAFLIPAFTRRERQALLPLLIGVPFLFYAGVAFGYFFALPRAVDFLQNFNADRFDILVQARDYYKFVLMFLAGTGLVFQVPVVVIGLARLGILTPGQMRKQRRMVVLASAIIAAIITPTPDAVTMLMLMLPLVVLFELSLLAADLWERRAPRGAGPSRWGLGDDEDDEDEDDPEDDPPTPTPVGPRGSGGSARPAVPDAPVGQDADERHRSPGGVAAARSAGREDPGVADDATWPDDALRDDAATEISWPDEDLRAESTFGEVDLSPDWSDGEDPDPALLGDPDGPQVAEGPAGAVSGPEFGIADDGDWRARADALDAADPFADPTDDHRPGGAADG